jgi:hypothetical protein
MENPFLEKGLSFLDDPTGNPVATVASRIGHLVVRASMDDKCSPVSWK